jgi:hypothetical protein
MHWPAASCPELFIRCTDQVQKRCWLAMRNATSNWNDRNPVLLKPLVRKRILVPIQRDLTGQGDHERGPPGSCLKRAKAREEEKA